MALLNFLFCSVLLYSTSYCLSVLPIEREVGTYPAARDPLPHLSDLCAFSRQGLTSRKIICIICKGFDPSCFHKSTTTTSTTTSSTTTSSPTTTTVSTSTKPTTTTTKATTTTAKDDTE